MDIVPIYKRVIGLDVHQAQITGCAITGQPDGSVTYERREFGGFKRDRKALAEWARSVGPDVVVMESTGIYWKSPYAALEAVGIITWVVNARHVKAVPGRKTDVADAQWLASLARAGLLKASFIAKADLRSLRHIARHRQKLGGMLASEKNRLHILLTDAGVRLGVVVSDLHGQSARNMVKLQHCLSTGKMNAPVWPAKNRQHAGVITQPPATRVVRVLVLSDSRRHGTIVAFCDLPFPKRTLVRDESMKMQGSTCVKFERRMLQILPASVGG